MNIDIPEEDGHEPILCDICGEEIKIDDKFLEVKTNKGIKPYKGGYVKGHGDFVWDYDISYIHLKHTLYSLT